MIALSMNYDPPIVMVPVIITHDSVERYHSSVPLQDGTCLTGKLRLNRLLDKLESKQILGCPSQVIL